MHINQPLTMTFLALAVSSSCFVADYQNVNDIPFQDNNFKSCVFAQKEQAPAAITQLVCRKAKVNKVDEFSLFPALKVL
ncbi:hypothetical protein ACVBIO_11125 [Shewanella sp. 0m-8]